MIVHCTSCQAKFRIADEKIGPRGAKARCSRCRTVFVVHGDLGAMPLPDGAPRPAPPGSPLPAVERPSVTGARAPLDVELERSERPAPAPQVADPFAFPPPPEPAQEEAGSPFAAHRDPFAVAGQSDPDPFGWTLPSPVAHGALEAPADPSQASADPFASPGATADPFAPAVYASGEPDPFASGASADPFGSGPGADSFGGSPGADSFGGGAGADPFGSGLGADSFAAPPGGASAFDAPAWPAGPEPAALLAQAAEPFAEAPSPTASRRLPLTDLSDLLGDGPGAPAQHPAPPADDLAAPPAGPDLTLEDHATPPAFHAPVMARELSLGGAATPEPIFGGGPELALSSEPAFAFGSPELELTGDLSPRKPRAPALAAELSGPLALATEPTPAPVARAPVRPPPLPSAAPPSPAGSALASLDAIAMPVADVASEAPPARPRAAPVPSRRARPRSGSRLTSLAVNALALAALLAVALAMLVVWRGGRLEAAAFRPAAIAAALRHGAVGTFVTAEVRSGLYERERGGPLLFVRGDVVSRAEAPVRSVRVAVEVVREGTVVARGEAVAGAVPTPEELWRARSAVALANVARAALARAPERIGPGDEVPFLVAIDEYPQELTGAALRISVAAEEERGR